MQYERVPFVCTWRRREYSGAAALDATGVCKDKDGNPVMKKWTDVTEKDIDAMLKATKFSPANRGYFRGGEGMGGRQKTVY